MRGGRASQLEKKGFCAEGGISNYPHLCPAAEGRAEMKPLAVSRLATARSLYTSASYFLSFGTISPAELSSHDHVWQVCEDFGKSSRMRRRRRKRRAGAFRAVCVLPAT